MSLWPEWAKNKGHALYDDLHRITHRGLWWPACRYEVMVWQLGSMLQGLAWHVYCLLRYEVLEQSKRFHLRMIENTKFLWNMYYHVKNRCMKKVNLAKNVTYEVLAWQQRYVTQFQSIGMQHRRWAVSAVQSCVYCNKHLMFNIILVWHCVDISHCQLLQPSEGMKNCRESVQNTFCNTHHIWR